MVVARKHLKLLSSDRVTPVQLSPTGFLFLTSSVAASQRQVERWCSKKARISLSLSIAFWRLTTSFAKFPTSTSAFALTSLANPQTSMYNPLRTRFAQATASSLTERVISEIIRPFLWNRPVMELHMRGAVGFTIKRPDSYLVRTPCAHFHFPSL